LRKSLSIALGLIFSAAPLWADPAAPENPCLWPEKAAAGAADHKKCLDNFIKAQEEAIRAHQGAINEALWDWERFKAELEAD
jgi:hypothetical protein